VQVAYLLPTPDVVQRECAPLLAIPDQYPKLLLTLGRLPPGDVRGIPHLNLVDWLLADSES